MNTCVKAAIGVQWRFMALSTHLRDLGILIPPQHQHADCVGELCRQRSPACVVVQQCCIINGTFLLRVPLIQLQI